MTARQELRARGGEQVKPSPFLIEGMAARRVDHEAVPRERDGGLDDGAKREFAVAPLCLHQSSHRPRHPGRERPGEAQIGGIAAPIDEHVARCAPRGSLPVIQGLDLAVRGADDHESAAADVAGCRVHDREREAHRDRGIDRVAPLLQDGPSHLAGDRAGRNHHGVCGLAAPGLSRVFPLGIDPLRTNLGQGGGGQQQAEEHGRAEAESTRNHGGRNLPLPMSSHSRPARFA